MVNLSEIKNNAIALIDNANDLKGIDDIRVKFFGKKGEITLIMQGFRDLSPEERKALGKEVNDVRTFIENLLNEKKTSFENALLNAKLKKEEIDVTLPGRGTKLGHRHPCSIVFNDVRRIFEKMGYTVVYGPEIEFAEYNFEKLNIEKGHPARDEQDTFYINEDVVLRTQTSPVQARVMEKHKLPICIISAGRVFRSDAVDATHSPTFHQIEGLLVSDNISFSDLKGTLTVFAKSLFGENIKTRFRPHHFPFTEPSAEMDVSCFKCGGKGCRFCKNEGWIEILGCGMVNPKVYELCGLDKDKCQGFAFGIGLERIALLKYEIDDMRLLYENDVRFLKQFN